jgi:two-component system, chemotaxis family, CheB/CheR fusion protein
MATSADLANFEQLLEHLRQTRGFDFTAYKRTSLIRRVLKRMHTVGVPTFDAYLDYLQLHPGEFAALFNTILINVTSFFRDPDVWAYIDTVILPQLLENRPVSEPLRVWSAGSASGEEAYSVAMLLAERLGVENVRERAKIYATDVDEEALTDGRRAVFSPSHLTGLPPGFAEKYFSIDDQGAVLSRELRRAVMFGRIDLLQDAPISRIDLLLCRNTLMYFTADAQKRILSRFSFSIAPQGFLVLGRAEMLFSHTAMFVPADLPRRIFRVVARASHRDRLAPPETGRENMSNGSSPQMRLRQAAFEADPTPQLIVDAAGVLISATAGARQQFGLRHMDIGKPLQELEVSYRPADLRGAIDSVVADRREVVIKDVHHVTAGQTRDYEVTLTPLLDEQHAAAGIRVHFVDCTSIHRLQSELHASKQELETAYEELQSTNEELETTNEELQSTVEELETTNEELQSTNEELETMNEELQSTNEELQTINDELRTRSLDADVLNTYLESVFSSLRSGVVVIDRDYRIRVWNRRAEDLWGIRTDEAVGAPFLSLDIGLPVAELAQPIRDVMNGEKSTLARTIRATTRRGKSIECHVSVTPLGAAEGASAGVILLMDDAAQPG